MKTSYRTKPLQATNRPPDWLNPRKALHVTRLLGYLAWHGRKVRMTPEHYAGFQDIDAAYALGAVDVHLVGDTAVVTLLVDNNRRGWL